MPNHPDADEDGNVFLDSDEDRFLIYGEEK
jgi:hypothetical protein